LKKSDLKTGMKVITNQEKEYIVLLNIKHSYCLESKIYTNILVNPVKDSCSWFNLNDFNDNLEEPITSTLIEKIYLPAHPYDIFYKHNDWKLIWERNKVIKMTVEEIEQKLGHKVEIIS
jgi:hypothetical protein